MDNGFPAKKKKKKKKLDDNWILFVNWYPCTLYQVTFLIRMVNRGAFGVVFFFLSFFFMPLTFSRIFRFL